MSRVLILAEHDGTALNPATARAVSCAKELGADEIAIAVLADDGQSVAEAAARLDGVGRVILVQHAANEHPLAAVMAPQLVELAQDCDYLLAPSTTFGKDVMPRVAALLGVPQVSDIMHVESPRVFQRPIYAGNAVTTVEVPEGLVVATVRSASYPAVGESGAVAEIETRALEVELPEHTSYLGLEGETGDRPDLQSANRVVSGGRGLGSAENFELIFKLADTLGAAVGASRAAVDAGYVHNDLQVGQTGKIIAPDLYLAFGISGAIQHLAGIKDAGVIVAVNKDPDAPIFSVADVGLVGDLFDVLSELQTKLG